MSILNNIKKILKEIEQLDIKEKIETINSIKLALHECSPFKSEPIDCVLWVPSDKVESNDYNPNSVAPPEMKLLELSIQADGYTQPIVTWQKNESNLEIVDGFHRNRVGKESNEIKQRILNHLPVVIINSDRENIDDRMAATIRHNRARGKHGIDAMSQMVVDLKRRNRSEEWIAKHLGMDQDEVLRLLQVSGLTEMFSNEQFSKSWDIDLDSDITNIEELDG